ncbi:MFS transporter [Porifericola rhodea]|uniref:MFS transporter n=1 Tax=Porifericola rhodea TaxID=930972 RepID=UPI002665776E|nr:MFS transporter [Porifericola rhodea]WKN32568.1 MFS transporter [Porifericola rhodea]
MHKPETTLNEKDTEKGLNLVLREGMATQSMIILTSGTFLIAFALALGATPLQIGIISAIPLYSNVLQILSIELVSRWKSRKKVVVIGTFIGRSAYAGIALLPFMPGEDYRLYVMMMALAVQHGMGAISNGSWSSWMRDLIPGKTRGRFLSYRLFCTQILSVLLSIGVAIMLDFIEQYYPGQDLYVYASLFMIGSLAGVMGSLLLYKTPEPIQTDAKEPLVSLLSLPFKHKNFRKLMAYMASWNFAVNMAVPFLTVYLLQTLGLSMTYVIGLTTLSQLGNIIFFRFWGYYSDRYSNKTILKLSAPLYILALAATVFCTLPNTHAFTLPLLITLYLIAGIATAGTGLASSSIGMALAPRKHSVAYLSVLSLTNALAAGTAPILAGLLAEYTTHWDWTLTTNLSLGSVTVLSLRHLDFLFVLTLLLGLHAMYRLKQIHEDGDVKTIVLIREIVLKVRRLYSGMIGKPIIIRVPMALYYTLAFSRKKSKSKIG